MTTPAVDLERATLDDLLTLGIQLEAGVQHLYGELARMFARDPEVARFWRLLAADEACHKNRLVQVRAAMSDTRLSQPADPKMIREARKLLGVDVEERLADVRDLDDAYELAHDLESSETNTIFRFFLTELSADMHVVATLMHDLDEHVERLMTGFPAGYSTRTSRMGLEAMRP